MAEPPGSESCRALRRACCIRVHHADEFHAFHFGPHPHVIASKFADAHHRNAYWLLVHDFLFDAAFCASPPALLILSGANASIAIPASSAARINASRSNSNVRPASIAKAVAFDRFIA